MAARQLLLQLSFIVLIFLSFFSTRKTVHPSDDFERLFPSITKTCPTVPVIRCRTPFSECLNQIPPSPHYQEPDSSPVPASDSFLEDFFSKFLRKNFDKGELDNGFNGVSQFLKISGYTTMAAFLDMQLYNRSSKKQRKLTIFAPLDRALIRNVSEFSSVFRAHIVPKRLPWKKLEKIKNGTELPTFSGHKIRVMRRSIKDGDDVIKFNGVRVIAQDMYDSRSFVVHGIRYLLVSRRS